MFVTVINEQKQEVTANTDEVYYTKDRTAKLTVFFHKGGAIWERTPGNPWKFGWLPIRDRLWFIVTEEGKDGMAYPTMDAAKAALRALSSDGKIYDEEGWDGVFVNGEVVRY